MKHFIIILFMAMPLIGLSQGVLITDTEGDSPDESAVLEIKSTTKGLLIPRMTTADRLSISNPKPGLLVYDTQAQAFFLYGNAVWKDLSLSAETWTNDEPNIYLSNTDNNVGIGTISPSGKLVIQADPMKNPDDPLLEVKDKDGATIFKVTSEGVRIYVKDYTETKGVSGGFAVGKYSTAKDLPADPYFVVTPDSTRVYIQDAVKGTAGGFAVGKYSTAKNPFSHKFFYTGMDSTRVYTTELPKGATGGFAVGKYSTAKNITYNYMHMTPDNYFIGHDAGQAITTGLYNLFLGYQSGYSNRTGELNTFVGHYSGHNNRWGDNNIYIGDHSGFSSIYAHDNIFIGNNAGYNTEADDMLYGSQNVFIGNNAGYSNLEGFYNVYIGMDAGHDNLNGYGNVFVGGSAGYENDDGDNTFIGGASFNHNTSGGENTGLGAYTGMNNITGNGNVFLGYKAGMNETGSNKLYIENSDSSLPLIYGEFDNDILIFNADLEVRGNVNASGGDFYTDNTDGVINCGGGFMNAMVNVISDGTVTNGYATGDEDLYIEDVLEVDGLAYKPGGGSWLTQSDKRFKKDIRPFKDGLEQVMQIKPVYFRYNDEAGVPGNKEYIGIIAQEIKDVAPYTVELSPFGQLVKEDENGNEIIVKAGDLRYTFDSSALTYLLINGMQEQQTEIESLKSQLNNQQKQIDELQAQIEALKNK